jgi:hypothetical protein
MYMRQFELDRFARASVQDSMVHGGVVHRDVLCIPSSRTPFATLMRQCAGAERMARDVLVAAGGVQRSPLP